MDGEFGLRKEEGARAPRLAGRTERSGRIAAEADPVPKRTPAPVLRLGERWRDRGRGPPVHHPGWLGAAPATRPGGSAALIGFDSRPSRDSQPAKVALAPGPWTGPSPISPMDRHRRGWPSSGRLGRSIDLLLAIGRTISVTPTWLPACVQADLLLTVSERTRTPFCFSRAVARATRGRSAPSSEPT